MNVAQPADIIVLSVIDSKNTCQLSEQKRLECMQNNTAGGKNW